MKKIIGFILCLFYFTASYSQNTTTNAQNKFPDPVAAVAGMAGGNISKEKLLAAATIEAAAKNGTTEVSFKINSFSLNIYRDKDNQWTYKSASDSLTDDMHAAIENCKPGDMLYFEYILCSGSDNTLRKLPSVNFVIE